MDKRYSELIRLSTFEERFNYLKLNGSVGVDTFGFDRVYNQMFYKSQEWRQIRNHIIARDNGCDLGIEDRVIGGRIYVHHMNPMSLLDIQDSSELLLNPEYLICVSFDTHQAIHYGDSSLLISEPIIRSSGDTCPWK